MAETFRLRDGAEVEVRPIEPGDREALAAGFARLGPDSRYKRFLSPVDRLSRAQLSYLTEIDHHDHEALVALEGGVVVAVARYVRVEPDGASAEVAVTVGDDWQGRGLGTALLGRVARRARQEGVETFTATVLGTNDTSVEVLRSLGDVTITRVGDGQIELAIALEGDSLRVLLQHAAAGVMQFLARVRPDPTGQREPGS